MTRVSTIGAPVLLVVMVTGCFWKLLTTQYTWADHPDMAYQVLPWYQFEADSFRRGEFPLWDSRVWGGQPLIGQMQPGAAFPLNWPLFLLPLRNGHIQLKWLNLYFILTHCLASLFCYWLCRDLGRTVSASVFSGTAFAVGGLVGSIDWPQMLNGAIWIPLVLLFFLRSIRGQRPLASAALAGMFLGISFLSGHPQIPTFTALMMVGLWLRELWYRRFSAFRHFVTFAAFAALVSAFQMLPAIEYGMRSIRWVGSTNPVFWNQYVPYSVHQQYSLPPIGVLDFALAGGYQYTFMGITTVTLALLGFTISFGEDVVILLGSVFTGGLLFALGGLSVFHGVAYLLIPLVEKARTPAFAIVIPQFALAVLAAYGIDGLRFRSAGRRSITLLAIIGALPWPLLATLSRLHEGGRAEYQQFAVSGLVGLALAAILYSWKLKHISARASIALIFITALFELGTVTGQSFRHRESPGGFLQELDKHDDIVNFLRKQPDFVRLEVDTDALPYNVGDWDGIDQFRSYLGGMTSNLAPFEEERLNGGRLATMLFALNYSAGRKPFRPGQTEVFRGTEGLTIYRNPEAFPRFWTIHESVSATAADLIPRLQKADLRRQVFLVNARLDLDRCDRKDDVQLLERHADRLLFKANMACKGMLILSQTFYPGWEATVDGRQERLYQAYGVLQGVVTGSGSHRVEFLYRPKTVFWGFSLTSLGLVVAFFAAARRAPGIMVRVSQWLHVVA